MLSDHLVLVHLAVFVLGLGIGGVSTVQEVIWADYFGRASIGMIRGLSRPFTVLASACRPTRPSMQAPTAAETRWPHPCRAASCWCEWPGVTRSEERRVREECGSTCRIRGAS